MNESRTRSGPREQGRQVTFYWGLTQEGSTMPWWPLLRSVDNSAAQDTLILACFRVSLGLPQNSD